MAIIAGVLIGGAIAGGVSTMAQGKAQEAASEQRNQQAYQQWLQNLREVANFNAREQFMSAYNFTQQTKRNAAISSSAYRTRTEKGQNAAEINTFQNTQLSRQATQAGASLLNAVTNKGISANSGLYAALSLAQNIDVINNATQLKKNYQTELQNLDREFRSTMSQRTENIFLPNLRIAGERPIYENSSAYATAGYIAGGAQIAGGIAGGVAGGAFG